MSPNCALTQRPSPKVTGEDGAEPLLEAKSLDPQEGALSTPSGFQPSSHPDAPPHTQGLPALPHPPPNPSRPVVT